MLTLVACAAPFLYARLPDPVPETQSANHWLHIHREDWPVLLRALLPTLCIATGAGLSIQFLNLFFSHVHQLSSTAYSGLWLRQQRAGALRRTDRAGSETPLRLARCDPRRADRRRDPARGDGADGTLESRRLGAAFRASVVSSCASRS